MEALICDGEEVDDVDNIREVIERTAFVLDWQGHHIVALSL